VTGGAELSRTIAETERLRWVTDKSFDAVLDGIYQGIGRRGIATVVSKLVTATSFDGFSHWVNDRDRPVKPDAVPAAGRGPGSGHQPSHA
jgi:hypothetical protein